MIIVTVVGVSVAIAVVLAVVGGAATAALAVGGGRHVEPHPDQEVDEQVEVLDREVNDAKVGRDGAGQDQVEDGRLHAVRIHGQGLLGVVEFVAGL